MPFLEIHVKNRLDPGKFDWLQGMTVQTMSPEDIRLCGEVPDLPVIYGILASFSTFGPSLKLISVICENGKSVSCPPG